MKNWIYVNAVGINGSRYGKTIGMVINTDDIHVITDEHEIKGGKCIIGLLLPGGNELARIEVKESIEDILAMLQEEEKYGNIHL